MHAIVPIKRFCIAKARLAPARTPFERTEIARGFAMRTLGELARARSLDGVTVVSNETSLRSFVRKLGLLWLDDPGGGLNAAIDYALTRAVEMGRNDIVVTPTDLPFLQAEELDRIAALHRAAPARRMTLVADRLGDGTNLRFCRPPRAVPPLYGPGSAGRHAACARARDIAVEFVSSPTLSIDCDTPADLDFLAHAASAPAQAPPLGDLAS